MDSHWKVWIVVALVAIIALGIGLVRQTDRIAAIEAKDARPAPAQYYDIHWQVPR